MSMQAPGSDGGNAGRLTGWGTAGGLGGGRQRGVRRPAGTTSALIGLGRCRGRRARRTLGVRSHGEVDRGVSVQGLGGCPSVPVGLGGALDIAVVYYELIKRAVSGWFSQEKA
jgi:hypothetical protein